MIRIKGAPVLLDAGDDRAAIDAKIAAFSKAYAAVFDRQNARVGGVKTMLSPLPSLAWIRGLGLVGIGADARSASVAADLGEQNIRVSAAAEDISRFAPIGEDDLFDMEYWSLEQAKLGKSKPPAFQGRVVMVTGGAGAIGLATARAFADEGAEVLLVDRDKAQLAGALDALGKGAGLALDVTAPELLLLVERVAARFRGDLLRVVGSSGSERRCLLQIIVRGKFAFLVALLTLFEHGRNFHQQFLLLLFLPVWVSKP